MTELQWYAARTKPTANPNRNTIKIGDQREFVVEHVLKKQGFHVFFPTKKVFRQKSKYSKEKREVLLPMFVGWVFVGWPEDQNRWADLFKANLIASVAGYGGQAMRIDPDDMEAALARWGGVATHAPERERFMQTHREFDVGDTVTVMSGPFADLPARVVSLRGSEARVMVDIFGRATPVQVNTMDLAA